MAIIATVGGAANKGHQPVSEDYLVSWPAPVLGVSRQQSIEKLPDTALYDGDNVLVYKNVLRQRHGLLPISSTALVGQGVGLFEHLTPGNSANVIAFQTDTFQLDTFQAQAIQPTQIAVAVTTKKIARRAGVSWIDLTDTDLTGTESYPARATSIEISGVAWLILVNGVDTPRKWNGSAATVTPVTGTPPTFSDVATAADRIIGIVPPYTIRWGNSLDLGTWPALNFRTLSDTADGLVAIRSFAGDNIVVYKQRSIWSGATTGGSDASYFRFDPKITVDGPAGPSAIVEVNGAHLYMTATGRFGLYDGIEHTWVGDWFWPFMEEHLAINYANRTHGYYDMITGLVTFFYPKIGHLGQVRGVVIAVPPQVSGLEQWSFFPGTTAYQVTASLGPLGADKVPLVLYTATARLAKVKDVTYDIDTAIQGSWQTGLQELPARDPVRVDVMEVFVERGVGFGSLTITPVYSNILDTGTGTTGTAFSVDLESLPKVKSPYGLEVRSRFIGYKGEFTQTTSLRWHMATMHGHRVE